MASASMGDGDPELKTDEALSSLTDFVTDVMIQLSDSNDDDQIRNFSNDTGGELIDVLKEARHMLGTVDIRYLANPSLDKLLANFIEQSNHLDREFNENKLKSSIRMMHHVRDVLTFYLSQSWNSDLPKPDELSSQDSARDVGGGSNSSDFEASDDTPKKVLKKVTPKKKEYSWTCSHCSKVFTNAESYNKHQNENNLNEKVEIPRVSCMLLKRGTEKRCTSKQPLSLMYRHLQQSHGISRPNSDQHLRYFESADGGKTFTNVVFMPLNASDPDQTTFIDYDQMKDAKTSPNKSKKRKAKVATKKNVIHVPKFPSKKAVSSIKSRKKLDFQEDSDGNAHEDNLEVNDAELNKSPEESDSRRGSSNSLDSNDSLNQVDSSFEEIRSRKRSFDLGGLDAIDEVPPVKIANQNQSFLDVEPEPEKYEAPSDDGATKRSDSDDLEEYSNDSTFQTDDEDNDEKNEDQSKTPKQVTVKVSTTSPESIDELPGSFDSDEDDSDTVEYSRVRVRNKKMRYAARDVEEAKETKLEDLPGNSEVITKFETFMKEVKYSMNANKDTSTIETNLKHLFFHPHSFLAYMNEQDPTFRLDRLLMFANVDLFLEIKSPMEWQMSEAGDSGILNPSKRSTMLKAHAAFRDFILEELESSNIGTDIPTLLRKEKLRANIQNIDKSLKKRKVWSELDRLEKEEKSERDNLKEGLNPNNNYNETVAVKKWFASKKFKELLDKHKAVWKKAIESNSISKTDFVAFANFAKFTLVLQDKNRAASYNYSNIQFVCGQKLWFPQVGDSKEGWNPHQPRDDRPHDAWQMKIPGTKSGQKFGRTVTVTVEGYSKDLMEKFRDLKSIVFEEQPDNDAPFFCNFEGNPLSVFKSTPGSLWSIFKETCDIDEATVTMIRRALEHKAKESQASLKRINVINNHSEEVGLSHYDKGAPDYRSSFLHEVSQQEGSSMAVDEELPEDVIKTRKSREEMDKATKAQVTHEKLSKATKARYSLGRNMKIFPEDKRFIQDLLSDDQYLELHSITCDDVFPAPKKFKSIFYRLVDSEDLKQEDRDRLREIEDKTFKVVKEEVSRKFVEGWDGGLEVNKAADSVVAAKIRNSLKIYEKTKAKHQPSFFLFK